MYPKLALLALAFSLAGNLSAQPAQPSVVWDPSPNFTAGRTATIDSIVIHTTEGTYSGAVSWLKNPSAGASAHYVIKEDGSEITQLVADTDRAWHATYYNNRSIGIECAGYAGQAGTWTQGILPALYELVAWLCYTYNVQVVHPAGTATLTPQTNDFNDVGLVAHQQVQPWNRTDPGAYFDWNALVTEVNNRLGNGLGPNDRIIDNTDPGFSTSSGSWSMGNTAAGRYGADYRFADSNAAATSECEWRPDLSEAGTYEVLVYYPSGANRADNAPFTVHHANGDTTLAVNQQANGGSWYSLGSFSFFAGTGGCVTLANNANPSVVLADAVWFKQIDAVAPTQPPSGGSSSGDSGCSSRPGHGWIWLGLAGLIGGLAVRRRFA